jgi:type III pantothenate kinase
MLLTIDIGNTNIVIGVYDVATLRGHWRLSSTITRTCDESWIITRLLFESAKIQDSQISGIAISSVVPGLTDVFIQMAEKHFGVEPVVVGSELDTGIKILYQTPNTVGADRICNAVGGFTKYGGPLIVVDLGTATTFDIITKHAEYLGGIIFPGIEMSASLLHHRTARLPKVALTFPEQIVGTTTTESIQSGLMYGSVEMIDGLVRRVMEERREQMQVVATGGLAHVLQKKSTQLKVIDPFLTLDGLRLIYERVTAPPPKSI